MAERGEQMEEEERRAEAVTFGARERSSSEIRAGVAREFRKTLNRTRPSRKRYSLSSAHFSRQQSATSTNTLEASGREFGAPSAASTRGGLSPASSFESESNPFLYSGHGGLDDADGAVSLGALDYIGEPIYREFEEYDSLSRVKNRLRRIIPQPIRKSMLPPRSWKEWQKFIFTHLPIVHWLWTYRPNQLLGDFIAGLTIGVTHISQGDILVKQPRSIV